MKTDEPYLILIRDSIDQIFRYLDGSGRESFLNNDLLKDACLTRLIVIGEYSGKIGESLKQRFAEVEWQQIKVARNFYVHAYGQVNWELIWETIRNFLPELKLKIENIISVLGNEK
jgi:uncharacterized protein with HEPN domain